MKMMTDSLPATFLNPNKTNYLWFFLCLSTKCLPVFLSDLILGPVAAHLQPTFQQPPLPLFRHVTLQLRPGADLLPRLEQRQDP